MDFNLIFEVLIAISILVALVGAIKAQQNVWYLKNIYNLGPSNLKVKLELAKQKKEVLSHKEKLSDGINSTLFSNMFIVIKQLLSLQKLLIQKRS